jgi:hypothetical protein
METEELRNEAGLHVERMAKSVLKGKPEWGIKLGRNKHR